MGLHVNYDLAIQQLPRECVEDCSRPWPADAAVQHWREVLGFTVDRERATACILGYGAWDADDLAAKPDEDIADIVLWLACGNFSEYAVEAADAGFDPYAVERPEAFEPNCGCDIFVLE